MPPKPPPAVRTVRDLLYWQYAKIIPESAGAGERRYGFMMDRWKGLRAGEIVWSTSIREWVRERESPNACIYCGATGDLSTDHLVPRARGGPDVADNAVVACRTCNSSKGDRGVYEWFGLVGKDDVPRVAEGKYLKLLYHMHERMGTLDAGRDDLERPCRDCEVGHLCEESKLTVHCLESVLMMAPR